MNLEYPSTFYRELRTGEFRLLLLKDDEEYGFKCELQTFSIDTNLAYICLSYTWGDSANVTTIKLDGHKFLIRKNLASALRRLNELGHHVVWADALCINQGDLLERGEQVSIMGNIFERAEEVIIWLDHISNQALIPPPVLKLLSAPYLTATRIIENGLVITGDLKSVQFLRALLSSEYWQRAWIIQEIAVASRVNLLVANQKIPWCNLAKIAEVLQPGHAQLESLSGTALYRETVAAHRHVKYGLAFLFTLDIIRKRKGDNFLNLLNWSAGSKQHEDIDVVYSKLGLSSDGRHFVPHPDYSKTCRQVFIELASGYIREKRNLRIICSTSQYVKDEANDNITDLGLPSWVPDWRLLQLFTFGNLVRVSSPELVFSAAANLEADYRILSQPGTETLIVHGFLYDTCCSKKTSSADLESGEPTIKLAAYFDQKTILDVINIFCRTAVANHLLTRNSICAEALAPPDLMLFRELMHEYYERGTLSPPYDSLFPSVFQSGRFNYRVRTCGLLDEWATIPIKGHCVKEWILACERSKIRPITDSFGERRLMFGRLMFALCSIAHRRKIMMGERGQICLVPEDTAPGDKICILSGCDVPTALRECGGRHVVVGCCYVDGIMHGEAVREHQMSRSALEEFHLI